MPNFTYKNSGRDRDRPDKFHISEYDGDALVATYDGYWSPKKRCYKLYPRTVWDEAYLKTTVKKTIGERDI